MLDTTIPKPHASPGPVVTAKAAPWRAGASDAIAHLGDQLRAIGAQHTSRAALLDALLDIQRQRAGVVGCAVFVKQSDGTLTLGPNKSGPDNTVARGSGTCSSNRTGFQADPLKSWIDGVCEQAVRSERPRTTYTANGDIAAICVPVRAGTIAALVTLVQHSDNSHRRESETAIAQLIATELDRWAQRRQLEEVSHQLADSAAIIELVQQVESSAGIKSACFTVAAALQDHLRCDRVIVGIKRGSGHACRVTAVSGVAEVDLHSEETRRMKAALDECLIRNQFSAWPPLPGADTPASTLQTSSDLQSSSVAGTRSDNQHQLLAHKQLARRDACVISVPLTTLDGESIGALSIVGPREMAAAPKVARFADALAEPLGSALASVRRAEGSRLRQIARTVTARRHSHKRWIAAAILLAGAVVLIIPVPYKVAGRSVTEPVERRFCVAPHDGLLESTLSEPGDVVQHGQRLARMDGREVRWELAGIAADTSRAAKRRDTHMARHETPDALLAELEMKRLDSRSQLLRFREQNLDITSPITGMVLSGSLDRRENYPVTKGQVLYEIAPLDSLRVEVSVPADDVTRVRPGMSVELTFDGLGGEVFNGRLKKIRPRSEIRNGENVFVAEVVIDNTDGHLRPGMKGRATIVSERQTIGWIAFHRVWEKVNTMWPW